jgi:hypothetical protein
MERSPLPMIIYMYKQIFFKDNFYRQTCCEMFRIKVSESYIWGLYVLFLLSVDGFWIEKFPCSPLFIRLVHLHPEVCQHMVMLMCVVQNVISVAMDCASEDVHLKCTNFVECTNEIGWFMWLPIVIVCCPLTPELLLVHCSWILLFFIGRNKWSSKRGFRNDSKMLGICWGMMAIFYL